MSSSRDMLCLVYSDEVELHTEARRPSKDERWLDRLVASAQFRDGLQAASFKYYTSNSHDTRQHPKGTRISARWSSQTVTMSARRDMFCLIHPAPSLLHTVLTATAET